MPTGIVGVTYTGAVHADGSAVIVYALTTGTLPAGLTFNTATGAITGIPTAGSTVDITTTFTVTATNPIGTSTSTCTITVHTPPTITSPAPPNGTVGAPYTFPVIATGSGPIIHTITGMLPPGLHLNPTTGLITGTPTTPGSYPITITATSAYGTDTQKDTIVIPAVPHTGTPPVITSLAPPQRHPRRPLPVPRHRHRPRTHHLHHHRHAAARAAPEPHHRVHHRYPHHPRRVPLHHHRNQRLRPRHRRIHHHHPRPTADTCTTERRQPGLHRHPGLLSHPHRRNVDLPWRSYPHPGPPPAPPTPITSQPPPTRSPTTHPGHQPCHTTHPVTLPPPGVPVPTCRRSQNEAIYKAGASYGPTSRTAVTYGVASAQSALQACRGPGSPYSINTI